MNKFAKAARAAGVAALAVTTLTATPAFANSAAVDYFRSRADNTSVPSLLSQDDRAFYKQALSLIHI